MKIKKILPQSEDFTEVLESIALKPKTLYYYGKMPKNVVLDGETRRPKTVAIVGTRKNTRYGEEIAYRAAYECAKAGAVVVSGLAYGIDSIAHRGALDAGGATIAVLGTAIDNVYPREHIPLAEEIVDKGGAIMSEYRPGTAFGAEMRSTFLMRNRLIAGLADITLVVEAAKRSGSLNTAMHTIDQGKDVFAVPGDINKPMSQGCNQLIAASALVYMSPQDLLDKLFPSGRKKRRKKSFIGGSAEEKLVMGELMGGVQDGDEIVAKTGLSVAEYNQAVTMLELKGVIEPMGGNCWMVK